MVSTETEICRGEESQYQKGLVGGQGGFPINNFGKENHENFHSSLKSYSCDLTKHVKFYFSSWEGGGDSLL